MRNWIILALAGCGLHHGAPEASECDHLWGQPSGYMASACCRTQGDCIAAQQASFQCAAPGTPLPFGNCPLSDCAVDADCRVTAPTSICRPLDCRTDGGGMCIGGCTSDATCATGEACDLATNHCHAAACTHATDCPTDFTCTNTTCARVTCTSDSDCSGYCVVGECYQTAGECRGPVG